MSILFSPLQLRSLTLPNRILVSPMCQYSSEDGMPNDWHFVHLGSRAVGGAALVCVEASGVTPEGRITPWDAGLWSSAHARAWKRVADFIRAQGVARAMTIEEIETTVEEFRRAAGYALEAGFDVVEVHGAHGYLLHSFASPLSNRRADKYGGPLENRMRLPLAVAKAVRDAWPAEKPVFYRMSATDWAEGGWDLAQSITLASELKAIGIDLIDCSSGGNIHDAKMGIGPGYQVPFAAAIREKSGIATAAVGLITEAAQAEQILALGQADAVCLARAFLRDPYWPRHAAKALGADMKWPDPYKRCDVGPLGR